VADRAVSELALLHAKLGHADALEALLGDLGERPLGGTAAVRLAAAREGLWVMRHEPEKAFLCGPMAIRMVLASTGDARAYDRRINALGSTRRGLTPADVAELAASLGLNLHPARRVWGAEVPVPSVVHWRAEHFAAIVGKATDARGRVRYRVQDTTFGERALGHGGFSGLPQ
jgi:hypothetical protein